MTAEDETDPNNPILADDNTGSATSAACFAGKMLPDLNRHLPRWWMCFLAPSISIPEPAEKGRFADLNKTDSGDVQARELNPTDFSSLHLYRAYLLTGRLPMEYVPYSISEPRQPERFEYLRRFAMRKIPSIQRYNHKDQLPHPQYCIHQNTDK